MARVAKRAWYSYDLARRLWHWLCRHPWETSLLLLGCLLRVCGLGLRSLWFDEAKSLIIAQASWRDFLPLVRGLEVTPPVYFALLHPWVRLFADPLIAARLFSVLCGVAGLFLFARIADRLLARQRVFALFLACFSSFWVHLSQDGRAYSLFMLEALASLHLLLLLLERPSPLRRGLYAAAALVGLYTHVFFAPLLVGQFLYYVLAAPRRPGQLRGWLALHGLLVAAYLPWLAVVRSQLAQPYTSLLTRPLDLHGIGALVGSFFFDAAFLGLALERGVTLLGLALLLMIGLAVAASWRTLRGPEGRTAVLCLSLLAIPLGSVILVEMVSGRAFNQPRYFVFLTPLLYILCAEVSGKPGFAARSFRAILGGIVLAGTTAYAFQGLWLDARLAKLTQAVRQHCDRRDIIVHMGPYYYPSLRYYYLPEFAHHLPCPDPKILAWEALPGYPAALGQAALGRAGRCVFIDPSRSWRGTVMGAAPCAEIAAAACP
ncbi:MAG: glycosyltransferase family 39 protein [Elusimicrobia bacterium]|nr:glycosyltransferase family 39 protein [Elusimicrobiota bacterium]